MSLTTASTESISSEFEPRPHSPSGVWETVKALLKPLASLQLTVALFALSMVLVFFGTVAQKNQGIWSVVAEYFWSWIVFIDLQLLVDFGKIFFSFLIPPDLQLPSWAKVPFPAGKLIGGLMFLNLLAAHLVRFKLSWKRSGIITLHAGILLLFVGEFITREFQIEQQMAIPEGESRNFAVDTRNYELAFVDRSIPEEDRVIVVPASLLKASLRRGEPLSHPLLPVRITVRAFYDNSDLQPLDTAKSNSDNLATTGLGLSGLAVEKPPVSGVDQSQRVDMPSAYVTLVDQETGTDLGTFLVSLWIGKPQPVEVAGKTYELSLRFTHYYKPFSLFLHDFEFKRFIGTNVAKDYSSRLQLIDPERDQNREITIRMNEPLRYRGEAFYQSSFSPDETTTILQVVRNPGWLLPYLACALVSLGMLLHFGLNLGSFLSRSRTKQSMRIIQVSESPAERVLFAVLVGFAAMYLTAMMVPRGSRGDFDLNAAGQIPVVDGGRVKPLDTVARKDLRLITHRESFTDATGVSQPAIRWFFDTASGSASDPGISSKHQIFRIENDQVLALLNLKPREGWRYSLEEIRGRYKEFEDAAQRALKRPDKDRDLFEAKVLELRRHLETFLEVWQGYSPLMLPPGDGKDWRSLASARDTARNEARLAARAKIGALNLPQNLEELTPQQQQQVMDLFDRELEAAIAKDPAAVAWEAILSAYRAGDANRFNKAVADYRDQFFGALSDRDLARVRFESYLNQTAPAYIAIVLYGYALLLTLVGWMALPILPRMGWTFRRAAFWVLVTTFLVHTFTLIGRMWLMDRPLVFVTNLYSSAVFIGWACVGLSLLIERLFPLGLGNFVAAALGITTGIIAHNLAVSGDTLEMMQAVLDTNFWLATHVTTVTLGYAATYVAGAVAIIYVVLGVFTPLLKKPMQFSATGSPTELGRVLGQIIYGVVCLATLLSFVGTVLGGIWADQSWGRFWGWDPKENGAVLIVIWNALILHARWAGLVKDRGIAVLALIGNMITTWSWFGTNQLGVGLHAYGFSNALATGCMVTWVVHAGLVALGLLPKSIWVSFRSSTAAAAATR